MEGRRIHDEGLEHEQDYVQERIEQTSDSDEFAEAAQRLRDEVQDLEGSTGNPGASGAEPELNALRRQATTPVERMEVRQGGELDASRGSPVDPEQQPPEAEARTRVVDGTGGGTWRTS